MNKWRKARKKPIVVQFREVEKPYEAFNTPEGLMIAHPDFHFVIKGVEGEVYPITKRIFSKTYDVLKEG